MRIFVTRQIDSQVLGIMANAADVEVNVWPEDQPVPHDVLRQVAQEYDVLVTMLTDLITDEIIKNSRVRLVSNMAVGFDNLDLAALSRYRVLATNTPDVLTDATAELAVGLTLSLMRGIESSSQAMRKGQWTGWHPQGFLGSELYGKTVGILGFGRIGQAFWQRISAFGVNGLVWSRRPPNPSAHLQYVDLDTLLQQADVVSIHLPLNDQTHHLIDRNRLQLMKKTAYLINTARGAIIRTEDLIDVLSRYELAGAALDVFDAEPLPSEHALTRLSQVLLTPHIGSATVETRRRMALRVWQNITDFRHNQRPRDLLNPQNW